MKILALESSATACSVALCEDEALIAQSFQNNGLTHSRTLMPMAVSLLDNCGTALDRAVAAFDAHVKRYAGAHLCLHARGLGDGFAVAVLLQYVVGSHVGAVDQFGDLQTGDFEHVLGLPQGWTDILASHLM